MNSENLERRALENRLNKELHRLLILSRNCTESVRASAALRCIPARDFCFDLKEVKDVLRLEGRESFRKAWDALSEKQICVKAARV